MNTQRPQADLETKATAYYLQYHLRTLDDIPNFTAGLAECVNAWRISERSDSMVNLALSCMALAVYAQTQRQPLAATEASERYYRLLPVVQKRLNEIGRPPVQDVDVDACLLAVFLLGRHSSATHDPSEPIPKDSPKWLQGWSHRDGSMALLKLWHDNRSDQPASPIVKQTRRGLIRASLLRDLPLPGWFAAGETFGEHGVELEYDRIIVRIVNLHARFASLQQEGDPTTPQLELVNAEAQNLDEVLQKWAARLPEQCSPTQHILKELQGPPQPHFYSQKVNTYAKLGHAALWSQYFAARMLLNSKLVRVLSLSRPDRPFLVFTYARQHQVCIANLKEMGENLAANVPFSLERVKVASHNSPSSQTSITLDTHEDIKPYLADLVIWPLSIAKCVEGFDDRLRQWFRSELGAVGEIIGDGIIQRAATDNWAAF